MERYVYGPALAMVGILAAAISATSSVTVVAASDEKVPLDKVPAKVMESVKAKYPKAEIASCVKEVEDGKTEFEFVVKQDGKEWEAKFDPEGKYLGREEVIPESEVPATVLEAFKKKYPGVKPTHYEKETTGEGDGAKVIFEVHFKVGDKAKEAKFDPAGKFVEEE